MKRTFFSLVVKTVVVIILAGNLAGVDVFAYDKEREDGNKVEQTRTQTPTDDSGVVFNKIKASSEVAKSISIKNGNIGKSVISVEKRKEYVEGEILVKYKNSRINLQTVSGRASALDFIRTKSLEKREDLRKNNISVLRIKDAKTVEQKITELKNDPNVEYAEPNYKRYPLDINTDDANGGLLWGLDNVGQTINGSYGNITGTDDADIDAPEAWVISETTTPAPVIVAVIDSGVAYNHPDLAANMWDGTSCKDADGNALGGCSHGYDYEGNDKIPLPTTSSHGTHIAGTIAAAMNNNKGIIGVAPQAKIMAIKYGFTVSSEIKSIDFAIQNGAKIINASFGGLNYSQSEFDAINRFKVAGGIFVAAAGNGDEFGDPNIGDVHGVDIDSYPCDFDLSNIICVAATDQNDALATFSDYGATSVDVGAPGTNIYSTVADSNVVSETFQSVTPPAVPSGWVKGGTHNKWATYDFSGDKVLYGQVPSFPYDNNANTTITSPSYNLGSNISGATMDFWTRCDTEYNMDFWTDYMALEFSDDGGSNFAEVLRWDEFFIDSDTDPSSGVIYHFEDLNIPSQYLISNFKFRFRWVTDSSVNNFDGCRVDDIKITKFSDGSDEQYGYRNGTSMATPHVAGLAALVWGYKSELSDTEVKNTILTTGDDLVSLAGKTATGKRINAFNALNSFAPVTHTISGTIKYYDGVKTVPNATVILENDVGAQIATTTTDANGVYQFTGVAHAGDYVVRISKSDNASGLTSADRIKIGRHIVGLELFDTIYKTIAGDVNNSGGLTSADRIKIGRFIVGLDANLPFGAWKFYPANAVLDVTNYLTFSQTRTYINLTVDMLNQDFVGVKMGDVNNSWVNP